MKGILGKKVGMSQLFTTEGIAISVSIIEVPENIVTKIITKEKNSYNAIQLAAFDKKQSRFLKPEIGHFAKANTKPKRFIKEFRDFQGYKLGQTVDVSIFSPGEFVDVTGTSKGKGFAGTIKRYNQAIGPRSHGGGGGSKPIRQTGSLGDISGNKVVKGMTMPGRLGHEKVTKQSLEIIKVDKENNLLVLKGSVPGPKKSFLVIKSAIKKPNPKNPVSLFVPNSDKEVKNE
ncbi:50S ribosomal protein L3 [Mesomycoplasma hyopneumoniae]|uniref:Large ribosomal subunit protein uL3 n=2 Tax=Mesomycoplasma hyopneumoniae TaxID=2099 RepID=RL3_MESH2|nr:50S ribosomal protein L3 [Mesomycoplasma hyopneumoniae]Q601L5.1 RecName: Full=Large ribosomal subunit protein uL3; AltName: Full=50S ribosomal protein L3 [Mesomycoplasma hyopneumoniae 232]AAV27444.1 50s ribosomal protein L3 [Mesomycoplasma hyopneumoniae 232]OWG15489.1 50S ribosomal protein L3 [Mesomycoplasma hyopneumoniae]VEU65880.1 50S ribosomal protein L3 [Mesomycoplasma hyopneumoniae]